MGASPSVIKLFNICSFQTRQRKLARTSTFTSSLLLHHQRKHLEIHSDYYCISDSSDDILPNIWTNALHLSTVHSCVRKELVTECKHDDWWRSSNQYCQQTLNFKYTLKLSACCVNSLWSRCSDIWRELVRRKLYYCMLLVSRDEKKSSKFEDVRKESLSTEFLSMSNAQLDKRLPVKHFMRWNRIEDFNLTNATQRICWILWCGLAIRWKALVDVES